MISGFDFPNQESSIEMARLDIVICTHADQAKMLDDLCYDCAMEKFEKMNRTNRAKEPLRTSLKTKAPLKTDESPVDRINKCMDLGLQIQTRIANLQAKGYTNEDIQTLFRVEANKLRFRPFVF